MKRKALMTRCQKRALRMGGWALASLLLWNPLLGAEVEEDIRDIRGLVHIPFPWLWAVYLSAGILVLVLIYLLYRFFQKRKKTESAPLPHEIAFEKLKHAEKLIHPEKAREFSILVSDAVRVYIEDRFHEKAAHRTTEEFLYTLLSNANSPLVPFSESLQDFLNHCDLAKFARWSLAEEQMRSMLTSARILVEKTKPVENGSPKRERPAPRPMVPGGAPPVLKT